MHGVAASVEHATIPVGNDIVTVFDVGANRGQFAIFALNRFPKAGVFCFEPLPKAVDQLCRVTAPYGKRVRVYRLALGEEAASAEMHVTHEDDSSSLLPITPLQTEMSPGTFEVARIAVEVRRLDDLIPADSVLRPCLLKIDVQGYELSVLRGAARTLESADFVLVECSYQEFYAGQALAPEVIAFIEQRGFTLLRSVPSALARSGECIQADLLFGRARRGGPHA